MMYQHHPDRLSRFFRGIYDFIQKSRETRRQLHADGDLSVEALPSFEEWMGNEGMAELSRWQDYTPAIDPKLN